jgi:hypothetical protein
MKPTPTKYVEFLDQYFDDMICDEKREIVIQRFWRCFGCNLRYARDVVQHYWITETIKRTKDGKREQ